MYYKAVQCSMSIKDMFTCTRTLYFRWFDHTRKNRGPDETCKPAYSGHQSKYLVKYCAYALEGKVSKCTKDNFKVQSIDA